jgi:hypothetical protein
MPQQGYVPGQGGSADGERVLHLGLRVPGRMGRHRRPGPPDRRPQSGWPGRHRKVTQQAAMGSGGSSGH